MLGFVMWSPDRKYYYGTRQPDEFEKILLEAHARLHWLAIEIKQNLAAIKKGIKP